MAQRPEMHGPPAYFTPDWVAAAASARALASLEPEVLATGHGVVFRGGPMRQALHTLAANFQHSEVPSYGRYAHQPAVTDEHGIVRLPPDPFPKVAAGLAAAAIAFGVMSRFGRTRNVEYR